MLKYHFSYSEERL